MERQPSERVRSSVPFPFHLPKQARIVLSKGPCRRVLRPQPLFIDGQRTLVERLGLLILALVVVEECQIVQARCCVGVLPPPHLFSDWQRTLVERLRPFLLRPVL